MSEPRTESRWMSVGEAARYLEITPKTLKRWDVPCYRFGPRRDHRYLQTDLDAWLAARRVE